MKKPEIIHGDCLREMRLLRKQGRVFQSVICDPPYHLTSIVKRFGKPGSAEAKAGVYGRSARGFMGKEWDGGDIAFNPVTWRLAYNLLPPGGWLLAFSATRTYHRMACAIEAAGFEVRDMIEWMYGTGFPKSHDVSKAIDRTAGAERQIIKNNPNHRPISGVGYEGVYQGKNTGAPHITAPATDSALEWQGWGTALKPAHEPICVARKPFVGTVADNMIKHRVGALNIDGCRIPAEKATGWGGNASNGYAGGLDKNEDGGRPVDGRWPANIVHDGSDAVRALFPDVDTQRATVTSTPGTVYGAGQGLPSHTGTYGFDESGSAARFFYSAKASEADKMGSGHPTCKPIDLMAHLCKLVTPPGGTVLDIFAGSGSTGVACLREGFQATLIERESEYVRDINARFDHICGLDLPLFKSFLAVDKK